MWHRWILGSSFFASRFFFGIGIAWVWAFSSLIWPLSPFTSCLWVSWYSYYATALFLLWCYLPLFIVPLLCLWVEVPAMPVLCVILSYIAQYSCWVSSYNILGFPDPFYSFGCPRPIPSFLLIPLFRLLRLVFCFLLFLMIPMGLLLHSLGFSWPVCFLWSHFVILWARGSLFLLFGLNGFFTLLLFFLHPFLYCWAFSVIGPFCQNGHQQWVRFFLHPLFYFCFCFCFFFLIS